MGVYDKYIDVTAFLKTKTKTNGLFAKTLNRNDNIMMSIVKCKLRSIIKR